MLNFKDASFYNEFFNHSNDFKLTKDFAKVTIKDKGEYFVGTIEAKHSVHPLAVRVEIPVDFPYHKLNFYTDSLEGYPHLIKIEKNESWFCLNTPFAEIAEIQLTLETERLQGWIAQCLDENLPAKITDPEVIKSLRRFHAYSWENPDEIEEYRRKAIATFIGDFASDPDFFKESKGYFDCIKSEGNTFYIMKNGQLSNAKLPYIIVNDAPNNIDDIKDFIALCNQYHWTKDTIDFLLPDFNAYPNNIFLDSIYGIPSCIENGMDESQALECLENAVTKLTYPDNHKELIESEIERQRKQIHENHGIKSEYGPIKKEGESDEEFEERQWQYEADNEYGTMIYLCILSYFFLGIRDNKTIIWLLLSTNRGLAKKHNIAGYNLGVTSITVYQLDSWKLYFDLPDTISENQYFGRGALYPSLSEMRVAFIGLGAIGSQIAMSLARSGLQHFGLWDNDVIELGNICRSTYDIHNAGDSKVQALSKQLSAINPFAKINKYGLWNEDPTTNIPLKYKNGDLYGNINYESQEKVIKQLEEYDLIIDCTASNELLHFLSYAIPNKQLISLCITNHSDNLLLISNIDGNAFELRKMYLSKLGQDTKNFYAEGSGCYSPTFLALNCDIATLVNLAVRELNNTIGKGLPLHSVIWSYDKRGVVADRLCYYRLKGYDIRMTISSEVLLDGEELDDVSDSHIGFLLGGYSSDGKLVMITHFIKASEANQKLADAYKTSNGIIDYIGDFCYSNDEEGSVSDGIRNALLEKANMETVNTNNPLLAVRTPMRQIKFYLLINGELALFEKEY